MSLKRLGAEGVRNLEAFTVEPGPGLNVVTGSNAAGKTSLLEAIFILARGRSFRTARLDRVTMAGEPGFGIRGRITEGGVAIPVSVERRDGATTVTVRGSPAENAAEIARLLPLQLINPDSHALVEGGPEYRRRFLDWGVFHVEHSFYTVWRRYRRALQQRNAALRAPGTDAAAWEAEMAATGEQIHAWRSAYAAALVGILPDWAGAILGDLPLAVTYRPGWDAAQDLDVALREGRDEDRRLGYSRHGPHRADLALWSGDRRVQDVASRGQQKLIASALLLAQAALLHDRGAGPCILLVDDLPAELDPDNCSRVLAATMALEAQTFVTCIDSGGLETATKAAPRWFHVEQGVLREVV